MILHPALVPTPSDAISALIKTTRLRLPSDAIDWFMYLWKIPKERPRVKRRILLMSGEDNVSFGVIERVGEWYGSSQRASMEAAATEVLRICQTQNWWAQRDGREYLYAWRIAEISPPDFRSISLAGLIEVMGRAVKQRDLLRGLAAFYAVYERKDFRPQQLARHLLEWASESGNPQAMRLAQVFSRHAQTLWTDSNISGQAYYSLLHGEFGEQGVPPEISPEIVVQSIQNSIERLQTPIEAPSFALDGIHTRSGKDARFSGVVRHMAAACKAYEHFGRLHPSDEWLPSFYDVPPVPVIGISGERQTTPNRC